MTTLPDRLLACPFCGSEPSLDERGDLFAVACKTCSARGDEYEFGAHAVREWNRRTPAAAPSAKGVADG